MLRRHASSARDLLDHLPFHDPVGIDASWVNGRRSFVRCRSAATLLGITIASYKPVVHLMHVWHDCRFIDPEPTFELRCVGSVFPSRVSPGSLELPLRSTG